MERDTRRQERVRHYSGQDVEGNAMTKYEALKIAEAVKAVQKTGHGSVEVVIQDGKILDVIRTERERLS